ncbi:RHS repeat-associated core domain-containing protein [Tunicatimonas pelagia]|uniref:RHS repeat-associated core domain-containing protein n=1 Tax=Tunicatimonas pelagia TaxID=931531 RepID=UPI002666CA76|nr:RHS repeat-associated core domain-containing protein [Tunicatimonas pelagia]WKN46404.1 RHS repeat-associated core domain-containing protein [Tunicatimonas pelagia]
MEQATYRYGYQGAFAEQDDETGLASFQLRQYDSRIGRWTTPDPYNQYWSPYLGMGNAPNMMIDPDGGAAAGVPSLLTRIKAWLTGGAISNSGRFVFNTRRTLNWGRIGLQAAKTAGTLASSNAWRLNERGLSNTSTINNESLQGNPNQEKQVIDRLTLWDANKHYREGDGEPLFVNASKIDLSFVNPDIFEEIGDRKVVSTLTKSRDGLVYGQLELIYFGGNKVKIVDNEYGFEIGAEDGHPWLKSAKGFGRNVATITGNIVAGPGTPYMIHFVGFGDLGYRPPPFEPNFPTSQKY